MWYVNQFNTENKLFENIFFLQYFYVILLSRKYLDF